MRKVVPFDDDAAADERLRRRLEAAGLRHWRVTGRSASGDHAEPGWGFVSRLDEAKAIGREFSQDAIFWVQHGEVRVCDCAPAAMLLRVGALAPRLNPPPTGDFPGRARLAAHFDGAPEKLAAMLRFLGPDPAARGAHAAAFLRDADDSPFTFGDRCEVAVRFQNRLEIAGRSSPFEKKNGYLHCCAEALLATSPALRPSYAAAFDEMWEKYGYEG